LIPLPTSLTTRMTRYPRAMAYRVILSAWVSRLSQF
jgi:hypothetical protein